MMEVCLSTAYLGNVQYFSKLLTANAVYIEQHENYLKQTYRNRCCILAANGMQVLSIPVEKESGSKTPIRDVRIDYHTAWQRTHWKSLCAAYRSSPFFEYYADDLRPFYERQERYLFDFNHALTLLLIELMGEEVSIGFTPSYQAEQPATCIDYRSSISPKERCQTPDPYFSSQPYHQVFSQRWGFIPNLSVVDLLFSEGPNAATLIRQSAL